MNQPDTENLLQKLAEAALTIAAENPWQGVTLSDLCAASETSLSACAQASVTKADVTAQLDLMVERTMLAAQTHVDRTMTVKDRLFDVLMSRYDGIEDNRGAWVSILQGEAGDGLAALARSARRARCAAWALEASGVSASDLGGAGRAIGLTRILRKIDAVWVNDGPDLAKTMAQLDQALRTGEAWIGRVRSVARFLGFKQAAEPTP
jgi:hypothetical protein